MRVWPSIFGIRFSGFAPRQEHYAVALVRYCTLVNLIAPSIHLSPNKCCLCCFVGGSTLYIETCLKEALSTDDAKSQPSLDVTGQLGDVMKESSHIAYTFAKVCILCLYIAYLLFSMVMRCFQKSAASVT